MKFKHIIWDYDGTLFDSYPIVAAAFHETLVAYGIDEDINEIYSLMKVTLAHANAHYKAKYNLDDAFFEQYKNLRTVSDADKTAPFSGAIELCAAICEAGGKNYLYTHRNDSAIAAIKKYGMAQHFIEFITSRQQFTPKPSPDAVLYLMEKYNIPPDEAIMIGDRDIDIMSGKNAGIFSCYFSDEGESCDVADYNVRSLSELYGVLGIV